MKRGRHDERKTEKLPDREDIEDVEQDTNDEVENKEDEILVRKRVGISRPRRPKSRSIVSWRLKGFRRRPQEEVSVYGAEATLLKYLKKCPKPLTWLSNNFSLSKAEVKTLANGLAKRGWDIRFKMDSKGEMIFSLNTDEDSDSLRIRSRSNLRPRSCACSSFSGPRLGTYQSQPSMMHWMYKAAGENVNCAFNLGDLVPGKAIPTLKVDMIPGMEEPEAQVEYAVKHMPGSKLFKTRIIGGRRELSMRGGQGYDVIRAICTARDDLVAEGELDRTFDFSGVTIRMMTPWDDNSPKTLDYGPLKILETMDPEPDILVLGGMGKMQVIPCCGKRGKTTIITLPSLHTQMRRESRKGINPDLGYVIVELEFDDDAQNGKINLAKNLRVHQILLNDYAVSNDWAKGVDEVDLSKVLNGGRLVMEWLLKEGAIPAGEISRRLGRAGHPKSKEEVKDLIERLCKGGANIQWRTDGKRYELIREHKDSFKPLAIDYDKVFAQLTKGASGACYHLNSKEEAPEVAQKAHDEAAEDGVRAFFMAGDLGDGLGECGYRGHSKDVKHLGADAALDHCVSNFPIPTKGTILATKERPLQKFIRDKKVKGRPVYDEVEVTDGEHRPQQFGIDGNHDRWSYTDFGYSPVRNMAMHLDEDLVFCGRTDGSITERGDVVFDHVFNRMLHGGGGMGSMYAKGKKYLNALVAEGTAAGQPTVLHLGNWHTSYVLFVRDGLVILDACFKQVDSFHVRLGLTSKVGLMVYELFGDKGKGNITRSVINFRSYRHLINELERQKMVGKKYSNPRHPRGFS